MIDLRAEPFENAQQSDKSMFWQQRQFRRSCLMVAAKGIVGKFVKSFAEYPPRGLPAGFSVGDALKMMSKPTHN